MVGVGDVGLFGSQCWKERDQGYPASDQGYPGAGVFKPPLPHRHGPARGTKSRPLNLAVHIPQTAWWSHPTHPIASPPSLPPPCIPRPPPSSSTPWTHAVSEHPSHLHTFVGTRPLPWSALPSSLCLFGWNPPLSSTPSQPHRSGRAPWNPTPDEAPHHLLTPPHLRRIIFICNIIIYTLQVLSTEVFQVDSTHSGRGHAKYRH